MERRTCKLCFKSFSNGRALGGHMRSHMATLRPSPHPSTKILQFGGDETQSASSSSSPSSSEEELDKGLGYGLRENPKKSFRSVDPEFSFAVDAGSSVIQDRESETESSKNPSRRRSKRNRYIKSGSSFTENQKHFQPDLKKSKSSSIRKISTKSGILAVVEPSEPVSSVSDTSPEEDVALCLMMLSRGSSNSKEEEYKIEEAEKSIEEESDDESEEIMKMKFSTPRSRNEGKYQCGTCKKVFRSYQALGGHRASHKKIKGCNNSVSLSRKIIYGHGNEFQEDNNNNNINKKKDAGAGVVASSSNADRKIHECPVCFRVFGSGQALGGHKKCHISGGSSSATTIINNIPNRTSNSTKLGDNLIDLNLPAPVDDGDDDDDDISQIELSAVLDAEFVNPIK